MRSAAKFRYSYDVEEDWMGPRKKHLVVEEASMKKLINDEMSRKANSRQNGPSIVARLMGMDMLPLDTKSTVYPMKKREEPARTKSSNFEKALRGPVNRSYSNSNSIEQEADPVYDRTSMKPKRREHPQEEELQKTRYRENEQVPTTIVVLKPGPDKIWSSEDSWTSFSGSSEERGSIEDFLEEVRERLKHELQGKIHQKGPIVPGSRITGPISEKSPDPQKIAKQISNQVRESVTRDLASRPSLVRSESTRSHRSDTQLNEMSSPEFINRDTRRFLAERLKNVLKRESDINIPVGVSAPVSGTSFGKLLLEDRHVITGAHIRRKHEHSIESLFAGTKKGKKEKERFSLREKVHNFRSTFTLRGRLFRKRMPSIADLRTCEPSFMKDIMNGPTVILNTGERYVNSTEVPPSPASVSSSSPLEEFWRPSNDLSPVLSPEKPEGDNADGPHVFGETSSTHNGIREHKPGGCKLPELEDGTAAYVRTLLVASGMYDGLSSSCLLRSDPLVKPITTSVYEEVEESYKQQDKEEDGHGSTMDDNKKGVEIDHRLLYDLLNEALSNMLRPPVISSRYRNKISATRDLQHPCGPRLMDAVWGFIRSFVYPPVDVSSHSSLDSMVSRDLGPAPWLWLLDEQVNAIGADIEGSILGDLIGEIVRDVKLR
ncbi:hypothetical protein CRG98_022532 [Punica granatum]|uniref:DUF4378 domain-containing protein n=1 Tax=Punica granatum TaxID=22663 RepID=A0A2I0JL77_PUNGR|nr:hypothetical protein CRG98_022532 [Punica granatum]